MAVIIHSCGGGNSIPSMAIASEVAIDSNGTYYLTATAGKEYLLVATGQPKQDDTSGAPSIASGCTVKSSCVSSKKATYAHTLTAVVTATSSQIGVYGYQGFAYLVAL